MTAWDNGSRDLPDVSNALLRVREEVKNGPVVPYIVSSRLQLDMRNICRDPVNRVGNLSQPLFGCLNRAFRNIQDGDVLESARNQVIDERGFAAPDINDR
jgi:hypothetical protein